MRITRSRYRPFVPGRHGRLTAVADWTTLTGTLDDPLRDANLAFARAHQGESPARQPVHTVYGGGHLFRGDIGPRLGVVALRSLDEYAPDAGAFAAAIGLPDDASLAERVYERVREKLGREPVEDFRIDFEDGYGARSDDEEDGHVSAAAREVGRGHRDGMLPPFIGIRVKPFNEEWRGRSARTLSLFLRTLAGDLDGGLPPGFVLTLPKITIVEQVSHFVERLQDLELELGLDERTLRFEIMVETPHVIMDARGECPLPAILAAGDERISAAHFGTYDYSAALGIAAAYQRMRHDACQHALRVMQVALAGTGIWLSDGSTTVLPVAIHRAVAGVPLTAGQVDENRASIRHAWRLHYDDVRHSLANGFYQGWDLHPAQLPTRFAALFAFFLEGLDTAGARLRNFIDRAAQATLVGDIFDDAATGQGLLNYFLRAINSGALTADEATARTALAPEELREKSFVKILQDRRRT